MTLATELPAPADSVLRGLDPRWKLVAVVACAALILALRNPLPLAVAFSGTLLLYGVARLPWRWYRNRTLLLLPLLLGLVALLPLILDDGGPSLTLFGMARVSLYGLLAALRLAFKALSILTLMLVLLGTTPMPDLFHAAHALRVPGFVVQLLALTFRYLMLLIEEFRRLRLALRVRGFRGGANLRTWRLVGNVTGTLLIRSLERAERVGKAMRCRGFDGTFRCLGEFRTRLADVLWFLVMLVLAGGVLAWDLLTQ